LILGGEDEGLASLKLVFEYLRKMSVNSSEFVFDQTIARGLSYYTGIVYETKVVAMPELGSVCSGGRYDNLIKQLGGPDLPAVGTSIGVDRLLVAMEKVGSQRINNKRILVTNWGGKAMETAIQLVAKLRSNGEYCELYPETVKIEKQMKYADKNRFDEVYLVGEVELNLGKVLIKNMVTGEQKLVDL
jgi:histidyl-tRNA synthetase